MNWVTAIVMGLAVGAVASAVMDGFQRVAEPAFGLGGSGDSGDESEPSTEEAADGASKLATGHPIPKRDKARAGTVVHYVLGIATGLFYVIAAFYWPPITIGFGIVYGLVLALVLDNFLVPLIGWSVWPWQASLGGNLFGLASHVVFGAALEAARRIGLALIGA